MNNKKFKKNKVNKFFSDNSPSPLRADNLIGFAV